MIAMGTLPASTNSSIRLALKGIYNYSSFKDTLRDNIRLLEGHGGTSGGQAHLLQDSQGNVYPHMWPEPSAKASEEDASASHITRGPEGIDLDALIAQAVNMSREGHDDETVLAVARGYARQPSGRFSSSSKPPRGGPPCGAPRFGPSSRVATPPRDPKDNKCANCNQPGHAHLNCPKPQVPKEQRKCHVCTQCQQVPQHAQVSSSRAGLRDFARPIPERHTFGSRSSRRWFLARCDEPERPPQKA